MIQAGLVENERDLEQILDLQGANLARNLSADEIAAQGFVTVEHSLDLLKRMHTIAPSIVARDGKSLAGYALVMPLQCRSFIPILEPMFTRLASLGMFEQRDLRRRAVARPRRVRSALPDPPAPPARNL